MRILIVCLLCQGISGCSRSLLTPTLWALKTLKPTPDEAKREYFVDIDVPLSEGHQYVPTRHKEDRADWGLGAREKRKNLKDKRATSAMKWRCTTTAGDNKLSGLELMEEGDDHGNGTPQPLRGLPQTHSANMPSLTEVTTALQPLIGHAQLHNVNEPSTFKDCIVGRILDGLKSRGGASSHDNGEDHDDVDDGQHDEPGVHIHHDVVSVDGENVTHVDDFLNDAVARDVTLQSNDAEGDHVPEVDALVKATTGRDENLASVQDLKNSMVEAYEAFKKDECVRRNIEILGDQGANFLTTLEDPKEEMTSEQIDSCLNILCKRMTRSKSKLYNASACWLIRYSSTPSICSTPHFQLNMACPLWKFQMSFRGTWRVVAKIDMVRWIIKVVDSARTSTVKDNGTRDLTPMPLKNHLPKAKVYRQNDSVSCVDLITPSLALVLSALTPVTASLGAPAAASLGAPAATSLGSLVVTSLGAPVAASLALLATLDFFL
ncbi:Uncharacterized protein TCM_036033 [Theobroma cacao]|uniref:Uncharacterized protein n=1 Tax=Theobroma cacao TaxID=3641 RepID=A0A061FJ57_THECC|nr:Uncharacterized protein TCM_036033 [Theobroma cacao]